MTKYKYEEILIAKLLMSLDRALTRPEILKYMKDQILASTQAGIKLVTDNEAIEFLNIADKGSK